MRAIVQRVLSASVVVNDEQVGAIGRGLLLFLGIGHDDEPAPLQAFAERLVKLRVFEDATGKTNRSLIDVSGALLVVSQFTLFADVSRGLRPSFEGARKPDEAEPLYNAFVSHARTLVPTQTGRFRADMRIESTQDGPFTLIF